MYSNLIFKERKKYKKKPRSERVQCTHIDEEIAFDITVDVDGLEKFVKHHRSLRRSSNRSEIRQSSDSLKDLNTMSTWNKRIK